MDVNSYNRIFTLDSFNSIWSLFLHVAKAKVYDEDGSRFYSFSSFECSFEQSCCIGRPFKNLKDFWRHIIDHMRPLTCEKLCNENNVAGIRGCMEEFFSAKDAERHYCMVK